MFDALRYMDYQEMVFNERQRQEVLKQQGKFLYTCADKELDNYECACVLVEEVGEVCRAIMYQAGIAKETKDINVGKELIQVAAVTMAWLEGLHLKNNLQRGVHNGEAS